MAISDSARAATGKARCTRRKRVWFREPPLPEEVMFDPDVCLLKRKVAERLKAAESERQSDSEMEQHKGQGFDLAAGGQSEVAASSTPVETEGAPSTVRLSLEGQDPVGRLEPRWPQAVAKATCRRQRGT